MLDKMAHVESVFNAARAYRNAKDPTKWADANPELWETYAKARKLERQHGN